MKCACVVLNYNDSKSTIDFVNGVIEYKIFDNIIIVDNCSTDNSYEEFLNFKKNDKIYVLRTPKNGGYGYGNNYGIAYAKDKLKCDYVVISNPDVKFSEDTVNEMVRVLSTNNDAVICAPVQLNADRNIIKEFAWKLPSCNEEIFTNGAIIYRLYKKNKYSFDKLKANEQYDVGCVPGAMLTVNVQHFEDIGGYDENVFLFFEEDILGYRAKNNGYRTILLLNKNYLHLHSVSINKNINRQSKKLKIFLKSRKYFIYTYLHPNNIQKTLNYIFSWIYFLEQILINTIKSVNN